jgi:2-oxoisovalerate dehydrogenase E1 component
MNMLSNIASPLDLQELKAVADNGFNCIVWPDVIAKHHQLLRSAYLIRCVEEGFLDAFNKGKMNGTVHTCVGQEFSAVCIAENLVDGDWMTSNHRCHGHFIAKTGEWQGLVDELLGNACGVCKGIGSSQHLYRRGFISNGPQGALLPVGTGVARRICENRNVVVSFIGEGTLGEGITYETLNMAALLRVPQVFVCENNFYSQSTPQAMNLSGRIVDRFRAFGIETVVANTWNLVELGRICCAAISLARDQQRPVAIVVATYRLKAHSKGDDDRNRDEINFFLERDVLAEAERRSVKLAEEFSGINAQVKQYFDSAVGKPELEARSYLVDQLPRRASARYLDVRPYEGRMIERVSGFLQKVAAEDWLLIGEDIADPYGGAFKATKGISSLYPKSVISTPISEASLVGIAAGYCLAGGRAIAEIMFGDFVTYCLDQIINGASKYHHMYGLQAECPLVVRLPMGGKRGYGATHSQSLEKFLCGIDNVVTIALTSICDPVDVFDELRALNCPALIVENKIEYGKRFPKVDDRLQIERNQGSFGHVRITPRYDLCHFTVITYGETARLLLDEYQRISEATDSVFDIVCLIRLHPLDLCDDVFRRIQQHGRVMLIEDGSIHFGVTAEIAAQLIEGRFDGKVRRLGAESVPIPSARSLEARCLVNADRIIEAIKELLDD